MNPKRSGTNQRSPQIQYIPKKMHNIPNSPKNKSNQVQHQIQYSDYQFPNQNQNKNEKILHHSIKRNFDEEGNAIITTKIVREVDLDGGDNILNTNSVMSVRPQNNYGSFYSNNEQENDILFYSNYSNNEEQENSSGVYNNQNFIFSPSTYNNSYENTFNGFNSFHSNAYEKDGNRKIYAGYGSPGNANLVNITSEMSPVLPNYNSGSDFEGPRPHQSRKVMNNIEYTYNQNSNLNSSQNIELNQGKYKKYNLENQQGSYKILNSFNSPEKQYTNYGFNDSYYRKSPLDEIKGIQPIYQEYKEKYNIRNNQIETSDDYDTSMSMNRYNSRNVYKGGKKMHGTHRNFTGNKQVYDIINEKAIQLQANIRGFLVRKKVLRYITLAIYYQSFCDKIQDVLCCHVKEEIFNILKQKLKIKSKYGRTGKKESLLTARKKRSQLGRSVNNINEISENVIKESYFSQKINTDSDTNNYRGFIKSRNKMGTEKVSTKDDTNRIMNYSYKQFNKFDYSVSPNSKIVHYYVNSPCSKDKPHHRYYKEISGNTSRNYYYRTDKNTKHVKSLKNIRDNVNKTFNFSEVKNKKRLYNEKYYLNDDNDGEYEYSRIYKEKIYRLPIESYASNTFQEKPEYTSGIGTRGVTRKVVQHKHSASNPNIRIYNDVKKFNENEIESDNYISINIVKAPQDKEKENNTKTLEAKKYLEDKNKIVNKTENVKSMTLLAEEQNRSKSVSTQDKFTNTIAEKNKISKRENISIIIKKKTTPKAKKSVKKVVDKKEQKKNKIRELMIKITYRKIMGDKMKLSNALMKWFKIANKMKRVDAEKKLRADQDKKDRERREREKREKEERDRKDREERERREKEEQILIERERKIKIEQEKIERDKREIERKNREDELRRKREEQERKEREEQERLERERQLQLEQERRERERKEKERKERLERERRERERKEKEEQLRLERERKLQEEKERQERERRERERKEREEKLRREREEREARLKKEREERERREREEQLKAERERKIKIEQEKREKERKEREQKQKEMERLKIIEKQRLERLEIIEREKKERERKQKEEQDRLAREKRQQEEKERREKERIERERREREERIRIEQEKREKERREREKKEKEKPKTTYKSNYGTTSKTTTTTTTVTETKTKEEKGGYGYYKKKYGQNKNKTPDYDRVISTETKFKKEKPKYRFGKIEEVVEEEETISKLNTFATQKTKRTKNDSFQYLSPNKILPKKNKIQTSSSVEYLIKPNIKTIKYKEEGVNVKFPPSFNPQDLKNQKENSESFKKKQKQQKEVILKTKRIDNINLQGVKKDCQKRLNELKMKMEEEFEKRLEMEKKKDLEEQRKNQEKSKKEIERLIEIQKQKDLEREREIEKEKELQKQRDLERDKQKEKEIKIGIQKEVEKILEERELEERNKKRKEIKMNKEIEFNIEENQGIILRRNREEDIERAKEIIRIFILSRGDPLLKQRKYFNTWRRKVQFLKLLDYSKIIQEYCKSNIEFSKIKKAIQRWKYLGKKIYYRTRIKLLKMRRGVNLKRKKLFELIRITRLNTIFARRRYIHYVILIWLIYTRCIHKKRSNMKFLYENLLKTYMNLADDIFGNNQKENPSVQDAMYEAVNSDKFITSLPEDVPLARIHYSEVRKMKSADTKDRDSTEEEKVLHKSSTTTKLEIGKKEYKKKYFMGKINENIKDENVSDSEDISKESKEKKADTYNNKYKSYNPGVARRQKFLYNNTSEKEEDIKDNKYGKKLKNLYEEQELKDEKNEENNILKYKYRFGKKYAKTEENIDDNLKEKEDNTSNEKYSYKKKYAYKTETKDVQDEKEDIETNEKYSYKKKFGYKSYKKEDSDSNKDDQSSSYKTKFGNQITFQGDVKLEVKESSKGEKSDENKHTNKYYGRFKGSIEKKESKDKSEDNDTKDNKNNNIQTTAWNRFKKKDEIKETNNEQNTYTQSLEFKALATGNIKVSEGSNSVKKGRFGFGLKESSIDDKNNKSNSESKFRFGYKSKKFNAGDNAEDVKDENTGTYRRVCVADVADFSLA